MQQAKHRLSEIAAVMAFLTLASGSAGATIVNISGTGSGCVQCSYGSPAMAPGAIVTMITPVQLTLGPGTYTITNASTVNGVESGADPSYLAFNFQAGNAIGWAWNFIVASDNGNSTATVIDYYGACCSERTQLAIASKTGTYSEDYFGRLAGTSTAGFIASLTLSQTTTLDFGIVDYYLPDNAGGVSLNIAPVPEPAAVWLLTWAFAALGLLKRRHARL